MILFDYSYLICKSMITRPVDSDLYPNIQKMAEMFVNMTADAKAAHITNNLYNEYGKRGMSSFYPIGVYTPAGRNDYAGVEVDPNEIMKQFFGSKAEIADPLLNGTEAVQGPNKEPLNASLRYGSESTGGVRRIDLNAMVGAKPAVLQLWSYDTSEGAVFAFRLVGKEHAQ